MKNIYLYLYKSLLHLIFFGNRQVNKLSAVFAVGGGGEFKELGGNVEGEKGLTVHWDI